MLRLENVHTVIIDLKSENAAAYSAHRNLASVRPQAIESHVIKTNLNLHKQHVQSVVHTMN